MTAEALAIAAGRPKMDMRTIEDRRPAKPEVVVEETRYVESDARLMQRLLGREVGGKQNILVMNDEAHHAYRIRQDGATEPREEDAEATNEELEEDLATSRPSGSTVSTGSTSTARINFCVDLSATPYFLGARRRGHEQDLPVGRQRLRPDRRDRVGAREDPAARRLAIRRARSKPRYFNIWRWIMSKLTGAERGGERANPKPEAILQCAEHPIAMLGGLWEATSGRSGPKATKNRPPVFILVCKNTKIASVSTNGSPRTRPPTGIPPAKIPELAQRDGNVNTIRVDSKVVHETDTEGAKNDESRWMRFTLDTVGKRRLAEGPAGAADLPRGVRGAGARSSNGRCTRPAGTCAASSASGC